MAVLMCTEEEKGMWKNRKSGRQLQIRMFQHAMRGLCVSGI